jgi:hypothetical protein
MDEKELKSAKSPEEIREAEEAAKPINIDGTVESQQEQEDEEEESS